MSNTQDEPQTGPKATPHSPLPWKVCRNGKQIDIHSKDSKENREWTVAQNLRQADAQFIVELVTQREPDWFLRNQAEQKLERVKAQRDELLALLKRVEHEDMTWKFANEIEATIAAVEEEWLKNYE